MQEFRVRLSNPIQHISIYIYFIVILVLNVVDNIFTTAVFYISALMCIFSLFQLNKKNGTDFRFMKLFALVCGALNIYYIHNLNFIKLLVLYLSFYIGGLLLYDGIEEKTYLHIYWVYVIVVAFRIFAKGLGYPVFAYVSNNYVSVYLLCPMLIYYIKTERKQDEINTVPAIVFWVICVLTTSRMGVFTASFILGFLLLCKSHEVKSRLRIKIIILLILFTVLLACFLLADIHDRYSELYIIQKFADRGFSSDSRTRMWIEYVNLLKARKYLFFGAPTNEVYWAAKYYEGNIHNSFLIVHAYLGILGFLGLVFLLLNSVKYGFKNKRWIYLIMLTAFCMRSFTDHVFGCNRISPIMVFLILIPFSSECNLNPIIHRNVS